MTTLDRSGHVDRLERLISPDSEKSPMLPSRDYMLPGFGRPEDRSARQNDRHRSPARSSVPAAARAPYGPRRHRFDSPTVTDKPIGISPPREICAWNKQQICACLHTNNRICPELRAARMRDRQEAGIAALISLAIATEPTVILPAVLNSPGNTVRPPSCLRIRVLDYRGTAIQHNGCGNSELVDFRDHGHLLYCAPWP